MKRLLALINWPLKDKLDDDTTHDHNLPFTIVSHHTRHNPEQDTQPMVRIGRRNPSDIQKAIDLAG